MSHPAKLNLDVYEGDDYSLTINFKDSSGNAVNMSGLTWSGQVRSKRRDADQTSGDTIATWTVDTTNEATGVIVITLTDTDTAALPDTSYWDLEAVSGTTTTTYLTGRVRLQHEVTWS